MPRKRSIARKAVRRAGAHFLVKRRIRELKSRLSEIDSRIIRMKNRLRADTFIVEELSKKPESSALKPMKEWKKADKEEHSKALSALEHERSFIASELARLLESRKK